MSRINVKQNRVQHKFRSAAMNMKEKKHRASISIAIDIKIRDSLRQNSQIITTSSASNGTKNNSNFVNVVIININTTITTAAVKVCRHKNCDCYTYFDCHHNNEAYI
jgi:hypothetical protein